MNRIKIKILGILVIFLIVFSTVAFSGEGKDVIRNLVESFKKYDPDKPETAKKINNILDLNHLLVRCMEKYWDNPKVITQSQKEELKDIFSLVVEKVGYTKIRDYFKDNEYRFTGERKEEKRIIVKMEVDFQDDDGNIETEELEFYLLKNGSKLIVDDIMFLQDSLVVEYANQFTAIIRQDGVDGLIDTMYETYEK